MSFNSRELANENLLEKLEAIKNEILNSGTVENEFFAPNPRWVKLRKECLEKYLNSINTYTIEEGVYVSREVYHRTLSSIYTKFKAEINTINGPSKNISPRFTRLLILEKYINFHDLNSRSGDIIDDSQERNELQLEISQIVKGIRRKGEVFELMQLSPTDLLRLAKDPTKDLESIRDILDTLKLAIGLVVSDKQPQPSAVQLSDTDISDPTVIDSEGISHTTSELQLSPTNTSNRRSGLIKNEYKRITSKEALTLLENLELSSNNKWRSIIAALSSHLSLCNIDFSVHAEILFNYSSLGDVDSERLNAIINDKGNLLVRRNEKELIKEYAYTYYGEKNDGYPLNYDLLRKLIEDKGIQGVEFIEPEEIEEPDNSIDLAQIVGNQSVQEESVCEVGTSEDSNGDKDTSPEDVKIENPPLANDVENKRKGRRTKYDVDDLVHFSQLYEPYDMTINEALTVVLNNKTHLENRDWRSILKAISRHLSTTEKINSSIQRELIFGDSINDKRFENLKYNQKNLQITPQEIELIKQYVFENYVLVDNSEPESTLESAPESELSDNQIGELGEESLVTESSPLTSEIGGVEPTHDEGQENSLQPLNDPEQVKTVDTRGIDEIGESIRFDLDTALNNLKGIQNYKQQLERSLEELYTKLSNSDKYIAEIITTLSKYVEFKNTVQANSIESMLCLTLDTEILILEGRLKHEENERVNTQSLIDSVNRKIEQINQLIVAYRDLELYTNAIATITNAMVQQTLGDGDED